MTMERNFAPPRLCGEKIKNFANKLKDSKFFSKNNVARYPHHPPQKT
jgi:hypothetical protein